MSKETKVIEMDLTNLSDLEPLDPACDFLQTLSRMYKKTLKAVMGNVVMLEISSEGFEKLVANEFDINDKVAEVAAEMAAHCGDECDAEELREIAAAIMPEKEKYVDQVVEFMKKHVKTIITLDTGYETCICLSDQSE